MSVVLLAACGPAVGVGDDGTDGVDGGGSADDSSAEGESSGGFACGAELEHGVVNRAQVASSLAAVLCIAQEACCVGARPSDSCRHAMNMTFEGLDAEALELGLAYDGACAGFQLAMVDALGCDTVRLPDLAEFGSCSIYFGDGAFGDACTAVGTLGSTCAQGLACAEGRCLDPCFTEAVDRPYVYGYACVGGEVVVGDRCERAVYLGAACSGNCAEGLLCNEEQECEAAGSSGDPCWVDGECRDLRCIEQVCAVGQPEGAPCGTGCGLGLQCDPATDRCAPEPYVCVGLSPL